MSRGAPHAIGELDPVTGKPPVATDEERLLIALDIDGTVLLEDESFSPGVAAAVREAANRGHIVTLSTGRSWEATFPVLGWLGLTPPYVVSANGATIMERDTTQETDYRRHTIETFDPSVVLSHIEGHLPNANYMVELPDGARLFNAFMDDWDLSRPNARRATIDEMKTHQVTRVVVVSPKHDPSEFVGFVEEMGLQHVSYSVGWSAWLDIAPQGIDKSTALEQVRQLTNIDPERVVTIGDGRNDIQMLEWAVAGGGQGIVMGQAVPEVMAAGNAVTGTVAEGGVAQALRRIGVAPR
ncbi:HAD-IIB family hydrolase [Microbacterium amylolyticum]|uniref:Cof subfamily protein (Haloacid dehalogenase superfamily) n=1 Tax=Microbacterium amylolyticum TaxID=936337 RepID=A0ABS4ZGG8_9MICO|nr:HAD-IIB family hydrolase [Microbacterium amylolyticum]MBP2436377.1 Cof subfamily protein (haloacid dehalogenase superfamily) [Microbacterium amylolyticum]